MLDIYVGETAKKEIEQNGFHQDMFDLFLGASGGPKWFVLAGLDRVIFPEFFKDRHRPIDVIGSSAGAFRAACFAQSDPLAAINRSAECYSHTVYSDKPDAAEITQKGKALLSYVLGDDGSRQILSNDIVRAHFIVARCKGLTRCENKFMQMLGLATSAAANFISRGFLQHFYQRYVFSLPSASIEIDDPYGLSSSFVSLATDNLFQALMASGSIPMVLEGVNDIPGSPKGVYRDGGIVDYHFDFSVKSAGRTQGLILYPHFYCKPVPGWFDKSFARRVPHKQSYDNTVMLVPSDEFVASLPYGKIPDRKDFENIEADTRIKYWQQVIAETDRLGECFMRMVSNGGIVDQIKPLTF